MRSDLYDIPGDIPQHETPVPQRCRPVARMPDPDDPPLSEDELDTVYGNTGTSGTNASPVSSSPSSRTSFERMSERPQRRESPPFSRKGLGRVIKKDVPEPGYLTALEVAPPQGIKPKSALRETKAKPDPAKAKARSVVIASAGLELAEVATSAALRRPRREIIQPDSVKPKVPRRKIATPIRRLPVDELLMVPTPLEQPDYLRAPDSSFAGIQTQDPIADSSSPAQKAVVPPAKDSSTKKETPLTSIRKRLKTPNFTHKSIVALRKKHNDQKKSCSKAERNLGDGFDSSELKARPCQSKKQRRNGTTLLRGLGALQLQPGPLPQVEFEASSGVSKVEPSDCAFVDHNNDAAQTLSRSDRLGERRNDRRVTFSDNFFDEATRAQLSSVSAPKRVFEISSDESEEEDEEEDEDDESDEEPAELADRGDPHFDVPPVDTATPPSFQRTKPTSPTEACTIATPAFTEPKSHRNPGVTLDFRKSSTPGFAKQSLRKQRLMEVDEMIIDDPFVDDGLSHTMRNRILDHQCGSNRSPEKERTHRPRSILRSSTPIRQDRVGTKLEDTVANTRRNSNIAIESAHFLAPPAGFGRELEVGNRQDVSYETTTRRRRTAVMVEDNNASYFGTAADQLQHPQQQAMLQPRRSNRPDAAASHFFAQRRREAELHVLDSSRAVPETSPERKTDYMTDLGMSLNVVRSNQGTMWTSSQSLPTAKPSKDLKSLTRSVSREYGTLSQSRRRRPTLPFQSPVKVGR